jgi:hypothetical protein
MAHRLETSLAPIRKSFGNSFKITVFSLTPLVGNITILAKTILAKSNATVIKNTHHRDHVIGVTSDALATSKCKFPSPLYGVS